MINVSQEWIAAHEQNILPETFVEITYGAVDDEAQRSLSVTGGDEEIFSDSGSVATSDVPPQYYATLERNLWSLNGTRAVFDPAEGRRNSGYVGEGGRTGSVQLSFPRVMDVLIPGITIVWSSEYNEYPKQFKVTARNGNTVVASKTITDNQSVTSVVNIDLINYDSIFIETYDWCTPDRRHRVDGATIGIGTTFTKKDLVSFSHECEGDLSSGFLPKNSIHFSLDNSAGIWNPDNPQGNVKYLAERQKLTVRYGMRVNDDIEWIDAGTFYLSEWDTPSGGMEAVFVARDVFEYMLNTPFLENVSGDFQTFIEAAMAASDLPDDFSYEMWDGMIRYEAEINDKRTAAEVVQMCANAAGCIIRQDRQGKLRIVPLVKENSGFTIPRRLSLSHPEVMLSKPLKSVTVSYGENLAYTLNVASSGENQTVDNPLITDAAQAEMVAEVARDSLVTRKMVKGEFRADPRLDLYDIVTVESKYGDIYPVVLTNLTYRYNGSFWATYSGRVIDPGVMES